MFTVRRANLGRPPAIRLLVLSLLFRTAFASIIQLHQKYHFYELTTVQNSSLDNSQRITTSHDFVQPFGDLVFGDGTCIERKNESNNFSSKRLSGGVDYFSLKASPLIYSNDELTLSFLLEISFTAHSGEQNGIRGYQVTVEINDDEYGNNTSQSCVQILPKPEQEPAEAYRLRIKDPSFVSIYNVNYTFFFGRVQVQALVGCHESQATADSPSSDNMFRVIDTLCLDENLKSQKVEVGIKKASDADITQPIHISQCHVDMREFTCVKKLSDYDSTFVVMFPMPTHFNQTLTSLFPNYAALQRTPEPHKKYGYFDPPIRSFPNQSYPNNLVFKLVEHRDSDLLPVSILLDPNEQNVCRNQTNMSCYKSSDSAAGCSPKSITCTECYGPIEDGSFGTKKLRFQFLNYNSSAKSFVSEFCSNVPELKAYDFDGVNLETKFRAQELNRTRYDVAGKRVFQSLKGNDLPRFCVKMGSKSRRLKIAFNDAFKTAQSSLLSQTIYQFRLLSFTYLKDKYSSNGVYRIKIKDELVSRRLVDLNDLDDIRLKEGNYLIELTPRIDHQLCPGVHKCIAESKRNNEFECVKCDKVIARFRLKYVTFEDVMSEPKKYYLNVNKMKICSADNQPFRLALEHSYLMDKQQQERQARNWAEKNISEAYKESSGSGSGPGPLVFESGLLPMDFDIENLFLRESDADVYYYTQELDSLLLIGLALTVLLVFGFLLVVTNFAYILSKSKFKFRSQNRTVLVYLSVFVSHDSQNELRNLMVNFQRCINEYFSNITIEIADYRSDPFQRDLLLKSSQLIIYVMGSNRELLDFYTNDRQQLKIGQHSFNHDYDRLRLIDEYRAKCVYMTTLLSHDDELRNGGGDLFRFPRDSKRLLALITNTSEYEHKGRHPDQRHHHRLHKVRCCLNSMPIKLLLNRLNRYLVKSTKLQVDNYARLLQHEQYLDAFENTLLADQIIFEEIDYTQDKKH